MKLDPNWLRLYQHIILIPVVSISGNLAFERISEKRLTNVLCNLNTSEAVGIDKILNKLLKAARLTIKEILLYIFSFVLVTGTFPDDLELAKVTPV